ncbi:MAG: hypothetical protein SFW66_03710 [Gammaproteobacteria bacterium]|nr:hypothetical protein [Gammaproteobacteria bacterium]
MLNEINVDNSDREPLIVDKSRIFSKNHCIKHGFKDLIHIQNPIDDQIIIIDDKSILPDKHDKHLFKHTLYTQKLICFDAGVKKGKFFSSKISLSQIFFISGVLDELLEQGVNDFATRLQTKLASLKKTPDEVYDYYCARGLIVLREFNHDLEIPALPEELKSFELELVRSNCLKMLEEQKQDEVNHYGVDDAQVLRDLISCQLM